ncbi:MAG: chromosome partitioning protein [Actinomycetota bacterium]|jgi:cellulose biosynthesis protein BcsQ|nr:chromosome partitioning protein [Actinomycetota bacterium]
MQVDRAALSRTIAVINGKGGVGKTSVTANLAGLFAAAGYRTLAVDLDPQGNLGNDLGYLGAGLGDEGHGLQAAVLSGGAPPVIAEVRPGLDVVAGGEALHDLVAVLQARRMTGRGGGTEALAASLGNIAGQYEATLLDCPPGTDVLQAGALEAARWVLVPTKTDDASRAGLRDVAKRFTAARQHNPDLELLGVVLFGVTSSARRVMRQAREALTSDLGDESVVFTAAIRHVEAAAVDARSRGQLVHELERDFLAGPPWWERRRNPEAHAGPLAASASSLAGDYERLADEVLTRISQEVPA